MATFLPLVMSGEAVSVSGASGAVMGVLVAYALINPEREFFLFPLPIPINARALVLIVIAMNIITGLQGGGGVSVWTHFGGMGAGFLYMKSVPLFRQWQRRQWRTQQTNKKDPLDTVGEAVDNIFKFEDRKRRR